MLNKLMSNPVKSWGLEIYFVNLCLMNSETSIHMNTTNYTEFIFHL